MAVGRRQPVNTMLYTVITFVALFVVAATVAVIFYVRAENYRKEVNRSQETINELVTSRQWTERGALVGAKEPRETYLGRLLGYIDEMLSMMLGGLAEETSAEGKVQFVTSKFNDTLESLQAKDYIQSTDPNGEGLFWVIDELSSNLSNTKMAEQQLRSQLEELQIRFDDMMSETLAKEEILLAEKEKYQKQVDEIRSDYNELKQLMQQSTEERVQSLMSELERAESRNETFNQRLMKTEAELKIAQERMDKAQSQLSKIVPPPDPNSPAYKSDGKILLVDTQSNIVHINIGREDKVYRGLAFSVYDRNAPMPKSGKGKAEIEVYNVGDTISAARIVESEIRNPILTGDKITNLIWDSNELNYFVVSGDFDLNGDGMIDSDGPTKVKSLIRRWGGEISETVSIEADYVVLGKEPKRLARPTFEQMGVDPLAMDKYEKSLARYNRYQNVMGQAKALSIPVFNTERFLYFIGYKSLSKREDAF